MLKVLVEIEVESNMVTKYRIGQKEVCSDV